MSNPARDRDRERLEQALHHPEYQQLLAQLQRKWPFFRQFPTWADVLAFMRKGTSRDPQKDEALRPIFQAHGTDQDPRWRTILLTIFWPGLESIHFQKRGWDADREECWQNVVWTFLQVVCRIDVQRRPSRLVQKVINDTVHHLHDEYQRVWGRANQEVTAEPEEIEARVGGVEGIDFTGIECRQAQVAEIRRLRAHFEAGRINETDLFLLVGTRVYGLSVANYARRMGLNYQVIKKRRQRAEAVIRRFEK